jgi:ribosomal protein L24E
MEYPGLLNWIDPVKLDWSALSLNPNPIALYILSQNLTKIDNLNLMMNKNTRAFSNKFYLKYLISNDDTYMEMFSANSNDLDLLKINIEKINWAYLSKNPNAIELLKTNPQNIDWTYLSSNPNAIELLKANPQNINWYNLSSNPNAIELLKANPNMINWHNLSGNPSAIELLKENPEKIDWKILSGNPSAIELLEQNPEKIKWSMVCNIQKKEAIDLIRNHLEKNRYNYLDWCELSCNPFAIELLKENPRRIHWDELSLNPAIFQYNYEKIKESRKNFTNEIIAVALNPVRINDLMKRYGRDVVYDTYF